MQSALPELDSADRKAYVELIEIFLRAGADVDIQLKDGSGREGPPLTVQKIITDALTPPETQRLLAVIEQVQSSK